jgi:hypothetical protein
LSSSGDEEQVGALERHEGRLAADPSCDGVAERAGEAFEDRGLEEEVPDLGGLLASTSSPR